MPQAKPPAMNLAAAYTPRSFSRQRHRWLRFDRASWSDHSERPLGIAGDGLIDPCGCFFSRHNAGMTISRAAAVLIVLLFATPAAQAATLYKCVSPSGLESIQSDPCPKGATLVWKRDATPEPLPTPEQAAALQARRDRESADARLMSQVAGTSRLEAPVAAPAPPPPPVVSKPSVDVPKGPCRLANEFSADLRAKPWLEMRDDQLRRLSDWVATQCREPEETRLPVQN